METSDLEYIRELLWLEYIASRGTIKPSKNSTFVMRKRCTVSEPRLDHAANLVLWLCYIRGASWLQGQSLNSSQRLGGIRALCIRSSISMFAFWMTIPVSRVM